MCLKMCGICHQRDTVLVATVPFCRSNKHLLNLFTSTHFFSPSFRGHEPAGKNVAQAFLARGTPKSKSGYLSCKWKYNLQIEANALGSTGRVDREVVR